MSSDADPPTAPIDGVHNRIDALYNSLQDLQDELERERERREELEAELQRRDARVDDLEQRLDEVDARTDLLDLVKHADDTTAAQRRVSLLMHLKREAERKDGHQIAAVGREGAATALHHPDIDRTTYYTDMREAANLIEDDAVADYADGELVLDLDAGDVPGEEVLRQRASEGSR